MTCTGRGQGQKRGREEARLGQTSKLQQKAQWRGPLHSCTEGQDDVRKATGRNHHATRGLPVPHEEIQVSQ